MTDDEKVASIKAFIQQAGASQELDLSMPTDVPQYYVVQTSTQRALVPLNVAARNELVHANHALIKSFSSDALSYSVDKKGSYQDDDYITHWKPSSIPFHLDFEISSSNDTCLHLASARKLCKQKPVSIQDEPLIIGLIKIDSICREDHTFSKEVPCQISCEPPLDLKFNSNVDRTSDRGAIIHIYHSLGLPFEVAILPMLRLKPGSKQP